MNAITRLEQVLVYDWHTVERLYRPEGEDRLCRLVVKSTDGRFIIWHKTATVCRWYRGSESVWECGRKRSANRRNYYGEIVASDAEGLEVRRMTQKEWLSVVEWKDRISQALVGEKLAFGIDVPPCYVDYDQWGVIEESDLEVAE